MEQTIYQVDAFTSKVFGGNPAAVCPLQAWLPDELLQKIALENNLSETAFYVREGEVFHIRWFTPSIEVDLCGHATLATAYVIFQYEGYEADTLVFTSRSGLLEVQRKEDLLELDFPTDTLVAVEAPNGLAEALGAVPKEVYKGRSDFLVVLDTETQIRTLKPHFQFIATLPCRGVIVTAPGDNVDFVSRFFGPQTGIDEDPVTGSAHTTLSPYWASKLGKTSFTARQVSSRGGELWCTLEGSRVKIAGKVAPYLKGFITIE